MNDTMTEQAIDQINPTEGLIGAAAQTRLEQWIGAADYEMQNLIKRGAELIQEIKGAKTDTKRKYLDKKLKKVRDDLRRVIVVRERLKANEAAGGNDAS